MFGALLLNEMWPLKTICSAFLVPQLQIFEEMAVPTSEKAHWKASYAVKETTDLFIKKKNQYFPMFFSQLNQLQPLPYFDLKRK